METNKNYWFSVIVGGGGRVNGAHRIFKIVKVPSYHTIMVDECLYTFIPSPQNIQHQE